MMIICQHYKIPQFIPASVQKYPLRTMLVGESFSFPAAELRSVQATINAMSRRLGASFSAIIRKDGSGHCWRTA